MASDGIGRANVPNPSWAFIARIRPQPRNDPMPRPPIVPNTNLKDFEGRFYSDELDTAYTARVSDGKLKLSHTRRGDAELADAGKDKFSGRIEFPVQIEFFRPAEKVSLLVCAGIVEIIAETQAIWCMIVR